MNVKMILDVVQFMIHIVMILVLFIYVLREILFYYIPLNLVVYMRNMLNVTIKFLGMNVIYETLSFFYNPSQPPKFHIVMILVHFIYVLREILFYYIHLNLVVYMKNILNVNIKFWGKWTSFTKHWVFFITRPNPQNGPKMIQFYFTLILQYKI